MANDKVAISCFSEQQIALFLSYIGMGPSHPLHTTRFSGDATKDAHFLRQLHIHTISAIPYENLSLHYNPEHKIYIKPEGTYQKVVGNARGRGGYCMENSIMFNHVLRGLGFPAYLTAVRIRHRVDGIPCGPYSGWVHLVNIIALTSGTKYAVDVGFGGDGPTFPVELISDVAQSNIGSQEIRLHYDHIPSQLHRTPETKLWIYQYRNSKNADWNAFYAFNETEAMEPDFHNINWYTGSHPDSFQTYTCIIVKFLRRSKSEGETDQEIYGKRMLINGVIKENLGGKTRTVKECKSESERLAALDEWFGMRFTDEEKAGIKGWSTELPGSEIN